MGNSEAKESRRIVVISPHPDDAELGCGGSIVKHIGQCKDVYVLLLSAGEKAGIERVEESKESLKVLGVQDACIYVEEFPDTKMNLLVAHIGNIITELFQALRPHIVYMPAREDLHQDHVAVNTAAHVAIKTVPNIEAIHEYESSNSMETFAPNYYEILSAIQVNTKLDAIAKHESQKHKYYMGMNNVKTRMMFRGYQTGSECMAEAFKTKIISRG